MKPKLKCEVGRLLSDEKRRTLELMVGTYVTGARIAVRNDIGSPCDSVHISAAIRVRLKGDPSPYDLQIETFSDQDEPEADEA